MCYSTTRNPVWKKATHVTANPKIKQNKNISFNILDKKTQNFVQNKKKNPK
jgi:hypothetical protein